MMSASLFFGSVLLNPKEILSCLIQNDRTSVTGLLLFHIRIPRMFGAIAAGMGLSCAGVILQTVMNNSLASPNTIGVNSGAGFAVMIGLALFHGRATHNAIFAFTGAFLTTLLIFALAYMADSKRTTIILALSLIHIFSYNYEDRASASFQSVPKHCPLFLSHTFPSFYSIPLIYPVAD